MRNISNKLMQAMENRRDFYASGEITFASGVKKPLEKKDLSISGNSIYDGAVSSSFPIGLLIPRQINLSLDNHDDRWSEYDFYGAKISLQTKYDFDDGTSEEINIGEYTIVTPESYGTVVGITAVDDSYKADKDYSTSLPFPVALGVALQDSCETCGINLLTTVFPNSDYMIPEAPVSITHRQFIGMVAMIAGGNAKFDEQNRLKIVPYDFAPFESLRWIDGGTFAPWTKGENVDGGTFNPWTVGEIIDGGTFGDRKDVHVLYQFANSVTVSADDVVITGVQMESEGEDGQKVTHLSGKEGYVLSLENQLAKGKEDEALKLIGEKVIGLRFRPFTGDHISLPTAEAMDLAVIIDRKNNAYTTVLTDVDFTYFGFTVMKCTADSPIRNQSIYYGNEAKAIVQARQMVETEKTQREQAVEALAKQLADGSGLYMTTEPQTGGGNIYYMHDKPSLKESKVVWKLTANAFGISTDGGKTYPYGLNASGVAILDRIYAIGINADYIKTGAIEISKNGKQMVLMDYDTGQVIIRPDTFELSSGATIESIAEGKANSALENAKSYTDTTAQSTLQSANGYADTVVSAEVNNFISKTYEPEIAELQKQLDGQIESYFENYEPTMQNKPASDWLTENDRLAHVGDIFYWEKEDGTSYSYRFMKDSSTSKWGWNLIQDTDITKAIADAAHAQDTADGKRRNFVITPYPPYDIGDQWTDDKTGEVYTCKTARTAGSSYVASDWVKINNYIDQTAADTAASNAVKGQTQLDIFNKLTNGGKEQGIFLRDGKIYINAQYMSVDYLSAISANLGTVTAGIIQSANYAYSTGNFTTAGFLLDLASGIIRSKNFGIDSNGNAHFKGALEGATGSFSGEVAASEFHLNGNQIKVASADLNFEGPDDEEVPGSIVTTWATQECVKEVLGSGGSTKPDTSGALFLNSVQGILTNGSISGIDYMGAREIWVKGKGHINNIVTKRINSSAYYENGTLLSSKYALKNKNQVLYSTRLSGVTANAYATAIIPGMSEYSEVRILAVVGDRFSQYLTFDKNTIEQIASAYANSSWNGGAKFLCNISSNTIGVMFLSGTGWTAANMHIDKVIGVI